MAGLSAGSLCWFEYGMTAFHGENRPVRGMGFLPFSNAVHYDDKPERRAAFVGAIADGLPAGYGTGDGAALHFVGTALAEVVASREKARAYHVAPEGTEVTETELSHAFPRRTARRGAGACRLSLPPPTPPAGGRPRSWRWAAAASPPAPAIPRSTKWCSS